jgi:hypothetical protein
MRGKGLRHLLPVIFTLLYVSLLLAGYPEEIQIRQIESCDTVIDRGPSPPPKSIVWALGISLPAVLATYPVVYTLSNSSPITGDFIGFVLIGIFTPWLWLAVGRWFDVRLGILNTPQTNALSDVKRCFLGLCLVGVLALDGLFLYALLLGHVYHSLVLACAVVFWSFLGGWYCFSRFRPRAARAPGRT